jgi:predicted XRE-type DNA-binding protein
MLRVKGAIDDRPEGTGQPVHVSIDRFLYRDLMKLKERNKKNWDGVIVIDGLPGVGKSQKAICTVAPVLAEKISNIHITFDIDEFIDICSSNKSKPFDVVDLDEGHAGMNTSQSQKADFHRMINLLMLVRKKKLFIIITTQCFFELSKAIAIFRSNLLYHVYADGRGKRGSFAAFGRNEKKQLYINGKKYLNYRAQKENYVGQFNQNRHLMPDDYEDRKDQHLIDQNKVLESGTAKRIDIASKIMDSAILNLTKLNFKQKDISKILGIGHTTVTEHWKKMKDLGKVPEVYLDLNKRRSLLPICPQNPL